MPQSTAELAYEQFLAAETTLRAAVGTNEATTRLRAIDTLLFEVLGWDKVQVETEQYCRLAGYADYTFFGSAGCALVLEAKKSGSYFLLKRIDYPTEAVGLALLAKESPEAEAALRQAIGYAVTLGARYTAITNGHQWLLTLTYVPGETIEQRSVLVFESLESIKDNKFRQFFNCFSPAAVDGNKPADALLESRKAPAPNKLCTSIEKYPRPATRNPIANELWAALSAVWGEVRHGEVDKEFLEQCYVRVDPTASQIMLARELISTRISADEAYRIAVDSHDDVTESIAEALTEKPIIVLGRVGHGKTTFLRYLRQIKAADLLTNYFQIDINFLDRPDSPEEVGSYIHDTVERQLLEIHNIDISADNLVRGFLHTDLARFKTSFEGRQYAEGTLEFKQAERDYIHSIRNDRHQYLARVFAHLKRGRHNSVAIFLDNLDRRNDKIQEEAFLKASSMARDWAALVFVCLRLSTFYRSKHFGVLDSVEPRVVVIVPPKTRLLVSKRLKYAQSVASGIVDSTRSAQGVQFGPAISAVLPTAAALLGAAAYSFKKNARLCNLFDAVSNGNARDTLTDVMNVLTSQHLNTEKILSKLQTGQYLMPVHEALRALIYGDSTDYDPARSKFINLFDISRADRAEHFTRLILLRHLNRLHSGYPTYGFLKVSIARTYLGQIGYSAEHVEGTLQYLFDNGYLDSAISQEKWASDVEAIRATDKAKYLINYLATTFSYYDAIVIDTPIVDAATRAIIHDVTSISKRLERATFFMNYLDVSAGTIQDNEFRNAWKQMSDSVHRDIAQITARIHS
ncbi:MAG: hypothetical protein WD669_11490 [Pirellulales bacterium]